MLQDTLKKAAPDTLQIVKWINGFQAGSGLTDEGFWTITGGIAGILLAFYLWFIKRYKVAKMTRKQLVGREAEGGNRGDLSNFFGVKYFIKTRYDRVSPRYEEDFRGQKDIQLQDTYWYRFTNLFLIRKLYEWRIYKGDKGKQELIPVLLSLLKKDTEFKFHIVLGTAGMGKSTMMKQLFHEYISPLKWGFEQNALFVACGKPSEITKMQEYSDKLNTVLFLDALDEFGGLSKKRTEMISPEEHFNRTIAPLMHTAAQFQKVIITCRTQYIPYEDRRDSFINLELPVENNIPEIYKLNKFYIWPFNEIEIRKYLDKKYKPWNFKKWEFKKRALNVVLNNPKILIRPMFLSYIDDLVEKDSYENTYEVYEQLLKKWAEREAVKPSLKSSLPNKTKLDEVLLSFTSDFAKRLYDHNLNTNAREISGLPIENEDAYEILNASQIKGKCLLVQDVDNRWLFAHKSIYEFLLANEAKENPALLLKLASSDFAGLDLVKTFLIESNVKIPPKIIQVQGGKFKHGKYQGEEMHDFWIGKFPVTQKEFAAFKPSHNSRFKGDNLPVEKVSWFEATQFCNFMNDKYKFDYKYDAHGNLSGTEGFRLPTEKEWEFAARGGVHSQGFKFAGNNELDKVAWYWQNSGDKPLSGEWDRDKILKNNGRTHPVGTLAPNELGIYDMNGNVWEWCEDWLDNKEERKVVRGGSWFSYGQYCTVANRDGWDPRYGYDFDGFRLSLQFK